MLPPPSGVWGLPPEELKTVIGYGDDVKENRDEARKLMEKAGFGPNKRLALKVSTRNLAVYRDPAVILIDQLKDIYIDGELDVIESGIWFAKVARKEYQIGLNLTGAGIDDPDQTFYENFGCGSERNYTNYCNKDLQAQFDAQSQEKDVAKRKKLVWEIDKKLQEDVARPILYHSRQGTCWAPYVKNVTIMSNSSYNGHRYEDVWMDKCAARPSSRRCRARSYPRSMYLETERIGYWHASARLGRTTNQRGGTLGRLSGPALSPDAADAVRHLGADLHAAAHRARQHRRHPVFLRRHDQSGRQGADREGARPRPAHRHPVRAVDRRPAPRRSRLFLHLRKADPAGDRAAPADQRQARRHGARLRGAVRHSARRDLGGAAEHAARLCAARGQPQRAVAAVVLARPADPDGVVQYFGWIPIYTTPPETLWDELLLSASRRPRSASAPPR